MTVPHLQISFQLQNLFKVSSSGSSINGSSYQGEWVRPLSGIVKASNSPPILCHNSLPKKTDVSESSCSVFSIEEKIKKASSNWISIKLGNSLMTVKTSSAGTHYHKGPHNFPSYRLGICFKKGAWRKAVKDSLFRMHCLESLAKRHRDGLYSISDCF